MSVSTRRDTVEDLERGRLASLRSMVGLLAVFFIPALLVSSWINAASGQQGVVDGPEPDYLNYESGPVRPLAMTPDGSTLLVANTPASQLDVFAVEPGSGDLSLRYSVPVGLDPVAVAARSDNEVWVVNHMSDSISVVDLTTRSVVGTLLVGDEPRDIVFAGPDNARAFITTAHRGQRRMDAALSAVPGAGDPQLTTPGIGRADAWVFDAANPGFDRGGIPVAIKSFFTDTPRALAVSRDGSTVYLAGLFSGNQTAVVGEPVVCDGFDENDTCRGDNIGSPGGLEGGRLPGGLPGPDTNTRGQRAVETSLIVKYNNDAGQWQDELGRNWNNGVRFTLPDRDVFAFDAMTLQSSSDFRHVGTTLFNMATDPATGHVFVTNTEAKNEVRFEGHAVDGGTTVQGRLALSQITIIDPVTGEVTPRHLNTHIDYDAHPAPEGTKDHTLATPLELVFSEDASTIYVAAYGSSKVGVIPKDALVAGTFDPTVESSNYIEVTGGGPSGLVRNDDAGVMYVFTRFDVGVSTVDLTTNAEVSHDLLFNPEPDAVRVGRPVMYDATFSSSNGESSCASCHIFGDLDALAWDLGNPNLAQQENLLDFELTFRSALGVRNINGTGDFDLNAMKGPMTTQTLKGMQNHGALHWRGDRAIGFFGESKDDERLNFMNFIVAFPELLGSELEPTDHELQKAMVDFTDFVMTMQLPPNPVRNLDRSFTPLQQAGDDLFRSDDRIDSGRRTCTECHEMNPELGRFGTNGNATFEGEVQDFKIAHIRNMYQKVGMFGLPENSQIRDGDNEHMGDQVRGTGFTHDGSVDTLERFFAADVFRTNSEERQAMEAAMLAADTDVAPIVGQQMTIVVNAGADAVSRVELFRSRSRTQFVSKELGGVTRECDLIAHRTVDTTTTGWLYVPSQDRFIADVEDGPTRSLSDLLSEVDATGVPTTFSCVTPGSGYRMSLDADLDRARNADERRVGTDPHDAASVSSACSDGIDNDGDGNVDTADAGCGDSSGTTEQPGCDDGIDGDGDGLVDLDDPGCAGRADFYETPCASHLVDVAPPTIGAIGDRTSTTSVDASVPVEVVDPNGFDVTLHAVGLPPGVLAGDLELRGAPSAAGTYDVVVAVRNEVNCNAVTSFEWTVVDNAAPSIAAISDRSDPVGTNISIQVLAADAEGDPFTFSASGLPAGLQIDPATGVVAGRLDAVGEWVSEISASDEFSTGTTSFVWEVTPLEVIVTTTCSPDQVDVEVFVLNTGPGFATYRAIVAGERQQASMSESLSKSFDFTVEPVAHFGVSIERNGSVVYEQHVDECEPAPPSTPTPVATPTPSPVPTPTPSPAPGDSAWVSVVASCLAGNGRVDITFVNLSDEASTFRLEFEGLSARQQVVEPGDWGRLPVTGRADGAYTVVVKMDGAAVATESVDVDCDDDTPSVTGAGVTIVNSCRFGNGYIMFQFVNEQPDDRRYVIEFDGVRNRSTTARAFGAAVRAVTGRPDGSYDVRIREGGTYTSTHTVEVDCD